MDRSKVYTREVWSANGWYLFSGILFIVMILILEVCVVREFFIKPFKEVIGVAVILQLPCSICLLFSTLIRDWVNRKKFNLYYCKLETDIDIDYIKENYSIEDISSNGILFVEKEDSHNFRVWKLLQGYKYMAEVEENYFVNKNRSSTVGG